MGILRYVCDTRRAWNYSSIGMNLKVKGIDMFRI